MKAVVFDLSIPRYLAAKALGARIPALYDGPQSCLTLRDDWPSPKLPGRDWVRLRPLLCGVCGTDLATVYFKAAPTLSPYGTYPFVPGHEVLARVMEIGPDVRSVREGDRVVVDPWLNCALRGATNCARCDAGETQCCERAGTGPSGGMMIGASRELPGGFGEEMVAHESQCFVMRDSTSDARAVLAEPIAVGVHAVVRNAPQGAERVLVLGGGPVAFSTVIALDALFPQADVTLFTIEKGQAQMAEALGAERAWTPGDTPLVDRAAELTRAAILKPLLGPKFLAGGFDRVFDCVGSAQSLRDSMGLCRANGTVVLVGAAGIVPELDLTHVWSKELHLVGTLGYGSEDWQGQRRRTFAITRELLEGTTRPIESLVTHSYPLERFQDALRTTLNRTRTGAIKTVVAPS